MRRVPTIVLLAFLIAAPAAAQSLPEKSDQVVQYRISVTLDPATRQLAGKQTLTWRNPSATDAVSELQFHLYLNAFKNTKSTFMKESGGQLRGDEMAKDGWGWIDITSIRTASGADLKPTLAFIQSDDGNKDDQTVIRATLPEAVPPGGSITLEMAFTSKLPQVFATDGVQGRLLPGRPVVPEARRLRAGRHAGARHGRMELPPVPRHLRVLCGLRQLRGRHHRAGRLRPRGHRRAEERADKQQRHEDVHLRAGRYP